MLCEWPCTLVIFQAEYEPQKRYAFWFLQFLRLCLLHYCRCCCFDLQNCVFWRCTLCYCIWYGFFQWWHCVVLHTLSNAFGHLSLSFLSIAQIHLYYTDIYNIKQYITFNLENRIHFQFTVHCASNIFLGFLFFPIYLRLDAFLYIRYQQFKHRKK